MRKTYSVRFIDSRDGYPNHKLIEAESSTAAILYMLELGHEPYEISEVD